jgi:hypothetical protein
MAARIEVVRALSACGRFKLTRAAARSVAMRMSPATLVTAAAPVADHDGAPHLFSSSTGLPRSLPQARESHVGCVFALYKIVA